MPKVADLKVAALQYVAGAQHFSGLWTPPEGQDERFDIGPTRELVPLIDSLRVELRDPMCISSGTVPRLREFAMDWGRRFLPDALRRNPPDILVIVPHGEVHDLPLHLVRINAETPLGARSGIAYASSRALFIRAAERNPARRRDVATERSLMAGGADVISELENAFLALCEMAAVHFSERATLFGTDGFGYTRNALKAAFRAKDPPSVVCAVAHGWIDPQNHRMSGLLVRRDTMGQVLRPILLHGGRYFDFRDMPLRAVPPDLPIRAEAEILTAAELEIDAATDCELALLLGCSAGSGRVLQGDEPASLAETWLKIGAASVAAPMWDSPLDAVREWLPGFLDAWVGRGLPKALAMREAMRRTLRGGEFDGPERLGVMVLRGDWL